MKRYTKHGHIKEKEFFELILRHKEKILVGTPKELEEVVEEVHLLHSNGNQNKFTASFGKRKSVRGREISSFLRKVNKVFDYDAFCDSYPIQKDMNRWGAYQLCLSLQVRVCPYCNRQYTTTLFRPKSISKSNPDEGISIRPDLDHFFDKATYPYLALSLFNLIPCCTICNSRIKGGKKFNLKDYIHPYVEGFGNKYRFTILLQGGSTIPESDKNADYYKVLVGNSNAFEIGFKGYTADTDFLQKAERTVNAFRLKELYNQHKDHVVELLQKMVAYNEDWAQSLYNSFDKELFQNEQEMLLMALGNHIAEENHDKRPLAKLISDIWAEFRLHDLLQKKP